MKTGVVSECNTDTPSHPVMSAPCRVELSDRDQSLLYREDKNLLTLAVDWMSVRSGVHGGVLWGRGVVG